MKITAQGTHLAAETDLNLPLFPEETSVQPTPPQLSRLQQPGGTSASRPLPLSLAQVSAKWKHVVRRLGRRRPILEPILAAGSPVRLVEQTLIVGFSPHRRFQRELLEVLEYRALVEEELSRTFGVPLAVTTALQPTRPGQRRDRVVGSWLGRKLIQKLPERKFGSFVEVLLVVSALTLIVR